METRPDDWRYYDDMVESIVKLAVRDYAKTLTDDRVDQLHLLPWGSSKEAVRNDCVSFFESDWFEGLTGADGDRFLAVLKRELDRGRAYELAHISWSFYGGTKRNGL